MDSRQSVALTEAALDAVITSDAAGAIVQFNSAAEAMFGLTRKEAIGEEVAELVIPPHLRSAQRSALARLRAGEPARALGRKLQLQALRHGGEAFPIEMTVTQTSESPALYTAFIRDLTSLRQAQDEARRRARLLSEAEEFVHMGSWTHNLGDDRSLWSDELYRIHGLEPGEVTPSLDLAVAFAHPEDRDYVSRVLSPVFRGSAATIGRDVTLEYRVVRRDGSVRELRLRGRVEAGPQGEVARWLGSVLDLTELRLPARELEAHDAVDKALRRWLSSGEGLSSLLWRLGTALEFSLGSLWTFDPGRDGLGCRTFWAGPGVDAAEFEAVLRAVTLRPGQGVAGRAWETGRPIFSEDVTADPRTVDREFEASTGLQSGLAFPAVAGERPLAVAGLYTPDRRQPSDLLMHTLSRAGRELGRFLSEHRSEFVPPSLTDREMEILQLAAAGNTGPEIARQLIVSTSTVKSHFENIYVKLGVTDRAAAVARALRLGLIS
jgi:PAS domain S-box-containing protein